jgi:hypothetical protein
MSSPSTLDTLTCPALTGGAFSDRRPPPRAPSARLTTVCRIVASVLACLLLGTIERVPATFAIRAYRAMEAVRREQTAAWQRSEKFE